MSQYRIGETWDLPAVTRGPGATGAGGGRSALVRSYFFVLFVLALAFIVRAPQVPPPTAAAALMIFVAALTPGYFWCSGRSAGLPIFPVFALTFTWTYGLPLLTEHPRTMQYTPDDHLVAGMAVSGFLVLATLVWLALSWQRPLPRRVLLVLDSRRGVPWLIGSLAFNAVLHAAMQAGWVSMSAGTYTIVRAVALGLSTVAAFVLPYLWSRGSLRGPAAALAAATFALNAVTSMTGLLLVDVLSSCGLAVLGMTLGGRRVPVLSLIVTLGLLVPLHYGKHRMRDLYWSNGADHDAVQLTPAQYPQFFAEWYGYSIEGITGERTDSRTEAINTRASLIQLFLLARDQQEHGTTPLAGATYAIIPTLLVPRILMPDKAASHEGTYLLNIHYGLQRRVDTYRTTIGWGLFNEAFGNFGYEGLIGLALVIGGALGAYARWTQSIPELSARYLVSVLVLALAFQTEYSAGVLVTALFQSTVAIAGLVLLLGGRRTIVPGTARRVPGAKSDEERTDAFPGPSLVA